MLNEDKIQRLSFARYLLTQAQVYKDKPFPASSFTLLIMHDAVEIFLHVAFEIYCPSLTKPKDRVLVFCTERINEELRKLSKQTINVNFIRRINERRNPLKHSSILQEPSIVSSLCVETEKFFLDFSIELFEVELRKLSFIVMIQDERVRQCLTSAESEIEREEFGVAVLSTVKAFKFLETALVTTRQVQSFFLRSAYMSTLNNRSMGTKPIAKDLSKFVERLSEDLSTLTGKISDIEKAVSFGIDYRQFLRFKKLTKEIHVIEKSDNDIVLHHAPPHVLNRRYTREEAEFCLDFVLEITLTTERS